MMITINLATEKWRLIAVCPNYAASNLGRIMRLNMAQGTYCGKILKAGDNSG